MQKGLCCNPFFFSFFSILSRWLGDKLKRRQNYLLCTGTFFACLEVFGGLEGKKKRRWILRRCSHWAVCFFLLFFFFLPVLGAAVPLGTGSHIKRRWLPMSSWLSRKIKRVKIRRSSQNVPLSEKFPSPVLLNMAVLAHASWQTSAWRAIKQKKNTRRTRPKHSAREPCREAGRSRLINIPL